MTDVPRQRLLDRPRAQIRPRQLPARGRRVVAVLLLAVAVVALTGAGLAVAVNASSLHVGRVAVVSEGTASFGVDYVDAPAVELVSYEHGSRFSYAIELSNDGPVAVTVQDVPVDHLIEELHLVRPTEVLLAPDGADAGGPIEDARPFEPFRLERGATRTVIVTGEFDNCAYYTERAIDVLRSHPVTWSVAGWSQTAHVELSRHLALRSPHIRGCPDRVMDRGAVTRTGA